MTPDNNLYQIGLSIIYNWINIIVEFDQVASTEFKCEQDRLRSNYIQKHQF